VGDRYTDFFLNARADAISLDLLEITHPAFTQAYRIVRNARDGVIVDLPADPPIAAMPGTQFIYRPVRVRRLARRTTSTPHPRGPRRLGRGAAARD
jgi:hypothetical protein